MCVFVVVVVVWGFFGCFRWESKSGLRYSSLASIGSHMVSLAAKSRHHTKNPGQQLSGISFISLDSRDRHGLSQQICSGIDP